MRQGARYPWPLPGLPQTGAGYNGRLVEHRPRVLVASQPEAWKRLRPVIEGLVDVVVAPTSTAAFQVLDQQRIDAIICTIAFDDSRMIDFLQVVKRTERSGAIPFICSRVLPGALGDEMVRTTAMISEQCGAATFVDIAKVDDDKARALFRAAFAACLGK